jgi:hypothetical protein
VIIGCSGNSPEEQKIINVIERNLEAMEKEDLTASLETIHSESPHYNANLELYSHNTI